MLPHRFLPLLALVTLSLRAEPVPWAASRIHGSPEPPKPFVAEQVFSNLRLKEALDMVPVPGSRQWVFVLNGGQLVVGPDDLSATQTTTALDLKAMHPDVDHAYGVAFHPRFQENRLVFVTYTNGDKKDDGSRLSRFKALQDTPLVLDPASEKVLLTWRSGGHNGAAAAFGNDGLLYVSTGDSEVPAPPDPLKTGQDLTDLLSSILRIDVDRADTGKAYHVPADNPFLKTRGARPEIYAYGLRNPWKMSFDRPTGRLWCGDVGWEQWEQIFLITSGGNYGWSATEGNNVLHPERRAGPSPITPPVVTHHHSEAASITGGFVYHGKRLPELEGAYIYGDYETGKLWALWHDGTQVTRHEEIASTPVKIVTFGQGPDGEIYFIHWNRESTVHRLALNPEAGKGGDFPRRLSQTGLFTDVARQTPAPGVRAFDIRAPMWADGAQGTRFIGLPAGAVSTALSPNDKGGIDSKVTWPKDAVLAKTLTLPAGDANTGVRRKIETQVLHYDGLSWNAYSYRWNEAGTDAELVGPAGDEARIELKGAQYPGGRHRYTYRFHSRAECLRCHNSWNGFVLAFQPQQIVDEKAVLAAGLADENYFRRNDTRLVNPSQEEAGLAARARSWLHANCAHCHRENGGGSVPVMLNAELPLERMRALNERPTRGDFGMAGTMVLAAGDACRSALLQRIATTGSGHMPAIGPHEVDDAGLRLLARWLEGMGQGGPPHDQKEEAAAALRMILDRDAGKPDEFARAVQAARTSPNSQVRGLFERFLPDDQRVETLGGSATVEKLLVQRGDAARGAELFTPAGKAAACLACHFVNGSGRDFGPNLSKVGARLQKPQIAEAVLLPSKTIAAGFNAVTFALADGSIQTGFVTRRAGNEITLKVPSGQSMTFDTAQVKRETALPVSLMPEGLLASFTAQEAADLLEYLASLR